jgi:hypothetical protein
MLNLLILEAIQEMDTLFDNPINWKRLDAMDTLFVNPINLKRLDAMMSIRDAITT